MALWFAVCGIEQLNDSPACHPEGLQQSYIRSLQGEGPILNQSGERTLTLFARYLASARDHQFHRRTRLHVGR